MTKSLMDPISKILLAVATSIVLFAGIIPSVFSGSWIWFGRSGSLLTAFGIMITFMDLTGVLDRWYEDLSQRIDNKLAARDLSNVPQEKLEKIEEVKRQIHEGMQASLRRIEMFVLLSGTVIWGYGDLL